MPFMYYTANVYRELQWVTGKLWFIYGEKLQNVLGELYAKHSDLANVQHNYMQFTRFQKIYRESM